MDVKTICLSMNGSIRAWYRNQREFVINRMFGNRKDEDLRSKEHRESKKVKTHHRDFTSKPLGKGKRDTSDTKKEEFETSSHTNACLKCSSSEHLLRDTQKHRTEISKAMGGVQGHLEVPCSTSRQGIGQWYRDGMTWPIFIQKIWRGYCVLNSGAIKAVVSARTLNVIEDLG